MSKSGRRSGDLLGAEVTKAVMREIKRRAPRDWEIISLRLTLRAKIQPDGVILIESPVLKAPSFIIGDGRKVSGPSV